MTEASEWQRSTDSGRAPSSARLPTGTGGGSASAGMTGSDVSPPGSSTPGGSGTTGTPDAASGPSQAVVGPFTLRESIFGGGVVLVFLGTLLPFIDGVVHYNNFWNSASLFFIGIGILLPVISLAMLAGRRLGTTGLRVGSLSVDQFASVTAVLAAVFFFLETVILFHAGPFVCLLGALAMMTATVLAPFLPVLKNDFVDRPEVPAHAVARPMTAARPRPEKSEKPEKLAKPAAEGATASPVASSPGSQHGKGLINPAAAGVRQNGAGLYGAGGAGAVGAGAAASGQSGLESATSRVGGDRTASESGPDRNSAGRQSVDDRAGTSGRGSTAAQDAVRPSGSTEAEDTAVSPSRNGRTDETRVNEVVREESGVTRSAFDRPEARPDAEERKRQEPITATRSAEEETVVEAFWFAVGSSRPVYDEQSGHEVFTLQPGDWEVGIEDRGDEFLVQDKRTGAVGILRDLSNIERAPRD